MKSRNASVGPALPSAPKVAEQDRGSIVALTLDRDGRLEDRAPVLRGRSKCVQSLRADGRSRVTEHGRDGRGIVEALAGAVEVHDGHGHVIQLTGKA